MGEKLLALDPWVLVVSGQDWESQVENDFYFFFQQFYLSGFLGRKETSGEVCIRGGFVCEQVCEGLVSWLERGALLWERCCCVPWETQ